MSELDEQARRAGVQVSRHYRLRWVVSILDELAAQNGLTPDDYRLYFMAWRTSYVLWPTHCGRVAGPTTRTLPTG